MEYTREQRIFGHNSRNGGKTQRRRKKRKEKEKKKEKGEGDLAKLGQMVNQVEEFSIPRGNEEKKG